MIWSDQERSLFREALQRWGRDLQTVVAVEEMAELTLLLVRGLRGREISQEDLQEEIADVLIMVGQLRVIAGAEEVDEMVEIKLERLWERLLDEGRRAGE